MNKVLFGLGGASLFLVLQSSSKALFSICLGILLSSKMIKVHLHDLSHVSVNLN